MTVAVNQSFDYVEYKKLFDQNKYAHIPNFFNDEYAKLLHSHVQDIQDWQFVTRTHEGRKEWPAAIIEQLEPEKKDKLIKELMELAAYEHHLIFLQHILIDHDGDFVIPEKPILSELSKWLNGSGFLSLVRNVMNESRVSHVSNVFISKFTCGHYVNAHTDGNDPNILGAFVINLTPAWRRDWGGILQLFDDNGHVKAGYVPRFNTLNLFALPAPHSVSYVAPFAIAERLSITGFIRKQP